MMKYLAKYRVDLPICEGGRYGPHKPEYSFEAGTKTEAEKIASEHKEAIVKEYSYPVSVSLESIIEVK